MGAISPKPGKMDTWYVSGKTASDKSMPHFMKQKTCKTGNDEK